MKSEMNIPEPLPLLGHYPRVPWGYDVWTRLQNGTSHMRGDVALHCTDVGMGIMENDAFLTFYIEPWWIDITNTKYKRERRYGCDEAKRRMGTSRQK